MAEQATTIDILVAADDGDLWQENDQRTTREYNHRLLGFSEPLRDVTEQADTAARDGLIRVRVGEHGARCWELTDAGRAALAEHDVKEPGRG
ncbi:hypothetical protein ACIODS_11980 [Micromonospora chalcea]|uniref:hypothetical protein n=1 Tax=Micromonospora chalcea TaxID=1874 RepID=UPI003804D20F